MRRFSLLMLFVFTILCSPVHAATVTFAPASSSQSYQFVHFDGVIVGGDAEQLEQRLQQASASRKKLAVMLKSRGGDVDVSMAIGQIIRRYGAVTYHGYCASACVYAFLGGVQRYMSFSDGAMLNVHRPQLAEAYVNAPSEGAAQMLNMLRDYTVGMIGSAHFYDAMMRIPFNTPRSLTSSEARSMNIITQAIN